MLTSSRLVGEGADNQLLRWNTTPNREIHIIIRTILRQAVLEEFTTIMQNILRDITKVEVNLTALMVWIVDERIHHPELNILIVRGFEVGLVEFTHDTTPTCFGIPQRTVFVQTARITFGAIHIIVVSTSF